MRLSLKRSQIDKLVGQRNGYMMLALGNSIISIFLIITIFLLIGRERIIVTPPVIEKSFWISGTRVSAEYLSEMTTFFANLRFNITPSNSNYQRDILLRYTDPQYYNILKSKLIKESDRIAEQHITMAFFPISIKVDIKNLKAIIEGDLKTFVGDVTLPVKRINYTITYRYDASRLLVTSFTEVNHA
jgi:conjugal transfer pilus assembly protein TraE